MFHAIGNGTAMSSPWHRQGSAMALPWHCHATTMPLPCIKLVPLETLGLLLNTSTEQALSRSPNPVQKYATRHQKGARRNRKVSKILSKRRQTYPSRNSGTTFELIQRPGHQILSKGMPQDTKRVPGETPKIGKSKQKTPKSDPRTYIE